MPADIGITASSGKRWRHRAVGRAVSDLSAAINASFCSLDKLKAAFKDASTKRLGSGWVWLIVGTDGKLTITLTPNQDNPLMDAAEIKCTPILSNDVWEHAYYIKYQNRCADYLDGWWRLVDWPQVSRRYAERGRESRT